jgi:1-aminocyclopropane-1-carboxylate deaminase/D-cysteine desulfhydrase-like pyridoxal-dependent ACC family enzyme
VSIDPLVPPWIAALPRHRLFDGPSPLGPLPRLSAALGGATELWIKREDLLPLAFGGNKLRNLEFLVGAALADDADALVTVGRRWSNHARLTAAAGAQAGLEVHLVLSGPAADPPNPGVLLDELLGAVVHQTATDDRTEREAMVDAVVTDLRAAGRRPYVIGVGGSGAVGAVGQVLAAIEADAQARVAGVSFDRIVLPTATGGTQAGLTVGTAIAGSDAVVTGMTVARPADELRPSIAATVRDLAAMAGTARAPDLLARPIELDDRAFGDGYGRPSAAAEDATRLLASTEGIFVDPIYTAKALAGLLAMVRAGALDGQRVLFWHAGGGPGLFEPLDQG